MNRPLYRCYHSTHRDVQTDGFLLCAGIHFLRMIQLLRTPELLQLLHIIKTNNHIRVVNVVTVMSIVWMLGTSMYFVVSELIPTVVIIITLVVRRWHENSTGLQKLSL